MKNLLFIIILFLVAACKTNIKVDENQLITPFESDSNVSATYFESIAFYEKLAKFYPQWVQIKQAGLSDAGLPIYTVHISSNLNVTKQKNGHQKVTIFINNGIHAGEPCGIDASMLMVKNLLNSSNVTELLSKVNLVVIPVYNVGGALRRNSTTRANQNGPAEYGFRGNALNLDLNRDFIKADSKNAKIFQQIFHQINPHVFVDTHTSNGADYQYTLTVLPTQHSKLTPPMDTFMRQVFTPEMMQRVNQKGWKTCPYVYAYGTPDKGIMGFYDSPRYASGYTTLFHCYGFTTETHMLKSFKSRVLSTLTFLNEIIQFSANNKEKIFSTIAQAKENTYQQTKFALDWKIDYSRMDSIEFLGYEAKYKPSEVSGKQRLYYDRMSPYLKKIPYYNYFIPTIEVQKPRFYIVPQALSKVLEHLQRNKIAFTTFEKDTILQVEQYQILDYSTAKKPYEGHYLHSEVEVKAAVKTIQFRKGDAVVSTQQPHVRFLMETLEPQGKDSYFAWNFFDSFMQQKEYFSSYVFEDVAAEILKNNPTLQQQLNEIKITDTTFANSANKQLEFIYLNSIYSEQTQNVYPVYRVF